MIAIDKERVVDARGLLCPWPVLRVTRAARELGGPGRLRVLADDPVAPGELESLCRERGWEFSAVEGEPGVFALNIG